MTTNIKKVNIALFFTCGVSLKVWEEIGIISREVALYNTLAENLESIVFFTYGDKSDFAYKKYLAPNIRIVPKPYWLHPKLYSVLLPIIHRKIIQRCDILKTNQMDGSWSAVLGRLLFGKKLIVRTGYCYSVSLKKIRLRLRYYVARIIERCAYAVADVAIVTSRKDKNYVTSQYGCEQVELIPNAVDTNRFCPQRKIKKKKTLCFVGRLSEEKNLFSLIRALQHTGIGLAIIGDGKLKEQLNKYAGEYNVEVQFFGIISNDKLPALLNQFEVFVLPSYFEGNPKALLEAMACGLCVIGTNVQGIREVITPNVTGLLCDTTSESLQSTIVSAFENPALREQLKRNAVECIRKQYSLQKIAAKELRLYAHLLFSSQNTHVKGQ